MKFDYDRAWRETRQLAGDNLGLVGAIGGMFFFLPYAILLVALPSLAALPAPAPDSSPDAMMGAMMEFYGQIWWALLIVALFVTMGTLAIVGLLKLRPKPTVAQASRNAFLGALPYVVAILIQSLAVGLAAGMVMALTAATGVAAIAFLGFLIAVGLEFYMFARLSLTGPVVAVEGERNPVRALATSWRITSGNGTRLLGFYALLFIGFVVSALVLMMIFGLLFALGGEAVQLFGSALLAAAMIAGFLTLLSCVLAAAHTQLSRRPARPIAD